MLHVEQYYNVTLYLASLEFTFWFEWLIAMNIKEKIGQRITAARQKTGLTIKDLAAKTQDLQAARISNWERGTRSPGPIEALQLAKVLDVSAAYLLGLVDDEKQASPDLIPLVDLKDNLDIKKLTGSVRDVMQFDHLMVDEYLATKIDARAFAIRIADDSMIPEFEPGDIIVIDPDKQPKPGKHVLAKIDDELIFRKYRELEDLGKSKSFELIPVNDYWPVIKITEPKKAKLIGTMVEHRRFR